VSRLADAQPGVFPASDTEMCEQYLDYVRKILIRSGIAPASAQDATQEVFTHLIRRNVRGMYKPEYVAQHGEKAVRSSFRTFLTAQVLLYARGIREKHQRIAGRELCVLDTPGDRSWAEALAGTWMDDYAGLEDSELLSRMRVWLALQPPTAPGEQDLLALFDGLAAESRDGRRLQLSPAKRKAALSSLREALEGAQGAPLPEVSFHVHGVTLSPADVHTAIQVLEAAKGIMVAGPLERASHPLARAAKGWYHPFSREEIAGFPELKTDPQTHRKPAGHVKLAVLHRLRRMLAESFDGNAEAQAPDQGQSETALPIPQAASLGVPEPEPPSPWDQIEATLWRLGAELADVDACREWAGQGGMVPA
jgi:hypothetical protein